MLKLEKIQSEILNSIKKNIPTNIISHFKSKLEEKGLRAAPEDFIALIEDNSPEGIKRALNYALDLFKPFFVGAGFRLARLSNTQVELIVPIKERNINEKGQIHEGVLISASIEATKAILKRHTPIGAELVYSVTKCQFEKINDSQRASDCRLRTELSETAIEATLAQLREYNKATVDSLITVVDDKELMLAQVHLSLGVQQVLSLTSQQMQGK